SAGRRTGRLSMRAASMSTSLAAFERGNRRAVIRTASTSGRSSASEGRALASRTLAAMTEVNMAVIPPGEERADVDAENTVAMARVAARLRQRRGPRNPPRGRYAYARAGRALRDRGRRQYRGGHCGREPAAPRY